MTIIETDYEPLYLAACERARELSKQLTRARLVVDAAVIWRRNGYANEDDLAVGIGPLLDAIDIYDIGAPRPTKGQ